MLRREHQFRANLGRIYSFSRGLRMDDNGDFRRPDVLACEAYARQTLDNIVTSPDDPFGYRLLDLWLDVFQRPWDQPTDLDELLADLAEKIGNGELKVYLEYDPNFEAMPLQVASGKEADDGNTGPGNVDEARVNQSNETTAEQPSASDQQLVGMASASSNEGAKIATDGGAPQELESAELTGNETNVDLDSPDSVQYEDFCDSVEEFEEQDELAKESFALFKKKKWDVLESLFKEHELNGGWPPNRGAINSVEVTLKLGAEIDRYGGFIDKETGQFRDKGKFTAKAGESFENRALPDSTKEKTYKQYKVAKSIPEVEASKAIPWFGKSGKGIQYELPTSIENLVSKGYLKEIV
ncbi:TNT domain-containing protein [Salicola sp. Rm-C-2C1-2]|uniref:TNT domain-containing protein n=1 Tax=Salicola sp. Rm-C-2C1-2 TaxID=3141321 RepID=UPI0032E4D7C6